jgi:hypothetical protein
MRRTLIHLRGILLGAAFVGAMGFGASQAFGSPKTAELKTCPAKGFDYAYAACGVGCPGGRGYCSESGTCICGLIP